jgi:hypothetical protein
LQERNLRAIQTQEQYSNRRDRIDEIASRYRNNILQTKSGRNGTNRWMQASISGNTEKANELSSRLENTQYSRSAYMGLSNG